MKKPGKITDRKRRTAPLAIVKGATDAQANAEVRELTPVQQQLARHAVRDIALAMQESSELRRKAQEIEAKAQVAFDAAINPIRAEHGVSEDKMCDITPSQDGSNLVLTIMDRPKE